MRASGLRQACGLLFNLLALLCILQNLWEADVPVVRYAWCPAAAAVLYVILRGRKAFLLFLRSRDSDAACLIFLAAVSFLALLFARGPGAKFANVAQWGRAIGAIARVLRFHDMFGNWWFLGLASVLGASLAAKLISRRAWRPLRAGLSSARAGLLLVLVAGIVWKTAGARGWVEVSEGAQTRTVRDADSLGSFELPCTVRLDPVEAGTHITVLTDDGPAAGGEPPVSWGGWRIRLYERRLHGASLFVVRDPGWGLAALGLVLVAGGFVFDAAASWRKGWA